MVRAHVLAREFAEAGEYVAVVPRHDGVRVFHFPARWAPALAEVEHEWAALVVISLAHALPAHLE